MMKDPEIYNIFDTEKILNRDPAVMVGQNSGLAGIAYWINGNYHLKGEEAVSKHDDIVVKMKEWIDSEYAAGRVTTIAASELEEKLNELSGGKFKAGKDDKS